MPNIADAEVHILAMYSEMLKQEYPERTAEWKESPFEWILRRPSKQKGTIGEKLVAGYLACKGFDVVRSPDSEADRLINGVRAEIKMSTLWGNGNYKFQQFRDQDYRFAVCLGIGPFDAHCWVLSKETIMRQWKSGGIKSQHGGSGGTDTAWLTVNPKEESPEWLNGCGGRLGQAIELIAMITGKEPLR